MTTNKIHKYIRNTIPFVLPAINPTRDAMPMSSTRAAIYSHTFGTGSSRRAPFDNRHRRCLRYTNDHLAHWVSLTSLTEPDWTPASRAVLRSGGHIVPPPLAEPSAFFGLFRIRGISQFVSHAVIKLPLVQLAIWQIELDVISRQDVG